MHDDIFCPTCGHSLAFHKFDYGVCDAPLGGLTSKNVCGCAFTLHMYIQKIQMEDGRDVELDQLKVKYSQLEMSHQLSIEEIAVSVDIMKLAKKKIEFLESKLKTVRELVDKLNPIEKTNTISKWFRIGYQDEIIKIYNEIISELEKDMDNG